MVTAIDGTIFEYLQYFSALLFLLALVFTVKRSMLNKMWGWDIPMILMLAHCFVYYVVLLLARIDSITTPNLFFTTWSVLRFLHIAATIFIISVGKYYMESKR